MASPRQRWGVGPLAPMDAATSQPQLITGLGPAAQVPAAASWLRCKALLVLALCLCATALPHRLGAQAAPAQAAPPASLPPSHTWPGLPACQSGTSDDLVATREDPLSYPVVYLRGRATMSSAGGFSDAQHGASVGRAAMRSWNGQKEEMRPRPGLPGHEDHTAAPHLVPLPELQSALPSEQTSSLTLVHTGTMGVPSAVTPEMLWDRWSAGTFLHSKASVLVGTISARVPGNESGIGGTVLASSPAATLAHGVNHPRVLPPFLPTAESGGPAVTSEKLSDLSSTHTERTLISTKAHPSPALAMVPSAAGPAVTEVSSASSGAIPGPAAVTAPCKDGAAVVASSSPRAAGVTGVSLLESPTQRPFLHPDPFLTTASEDGPAAGQHQPVKVAETSVLPGQMAMAEGAGDSEPKTAPAGHPGPMCASLGSVPPPSSKNSALEHSSEAVHHTDTMSLPSPSYLLASTRAVPTASSLAAPTGGIPSAQPVSGHSVTSQHPSTAGDHLPAAAGETSTPAEMMMGKPGSPEGKPTGLPTRAHSLPMHVLPLQFRLLGIAYTEALHHKSSGRYRELEEEVMLMLNQVLSTYETFLQANVLEFVNGSVVVRGEVLFRGNVPAPTNSHLIRTVITEASRGNGTFSWQLEPESVQSSGFSLENLEPEKLSISLTAFQLGRSGSDSLQMLISEVVRLLSDLYNVKNFTIVQFRNITGDLKITGDVYLDTIVHADVEEVLQALTALANFSVDLTSLSVEGTGLHLQVYPFSFLITNRRFSEDLQDPLVMEHQKLTRDLGHAVAGALRDQRSFLQVMIRGFLPGSLLCHGDLVFQHPAPTSLEVLEALVLSVGPDKALAGSDFQVDPYSLAVGEDTLEPPLPEPGFPEYGVAIVVVCGLCIIIVPIVLLGYLRTKRLGWQDMAVLWDRRDPEVGIQILEMTNQGFWTSSEQDTEDSCS